MDDGRHHLGHHDGGARFGFVLWRLGSQQEHVVGAHASHGDLLLGHGLVVHLRLQLGIYRRQRLHWWTRPLVHERHLGQRSWHLRQCSDFQQRRGHS